jgi:DNA (cytosine-5)-methyltransferase 1
VPCEPYIDTLRPHDHCAAVHAVSRRLRAVDVFAGAGGLSHGLAQGGFRIVAAVENDPQAADTYALSHPGVHVVVADTTTLDAAMLVPRLRAPLDLLAGGPPCQGFSIKGQRRGDHPGNAMLAEMVRLARELRPRAVLIENVVGLLSLAGGYYFDRLVTDLERVDLGDGRRYTVDYRVLNAAEFRVPQQRRRLFTVATAPGVDFRWPAPSTRPGDISLWDAIGDLPTATVDPGERTTYPSPAIVSPYALALRSTMTHVTCHHTKRLEEKRQQRLRALDQGQNATHLPIGLAAGGHETKYRRLRPHSPSPTVTAHMGKDLSDFIHPYEHRTLTVREAARLQGFPDDVEFLGSQAAQFRQVGNAVPAPLAQALARELARAIRRYDRSAPAVPRLSLVPTDPAPADNDEEGTAAIG